MKYWIKSVSPLVIRNSYVNTADEMMEWIDFVIGETKKEFNEKEEFFPPDGGMDVLNKCFTLFKVDTKLNPRLEQVLKTDPESQKWRTPRKEVLEHLRGEIARFSNVKSKKRGRPKKIQSPQVIINAI